MDISQIGNWITENESLLSGLAALVVLGGLILSPVGAGLRRFFGHSGRSQHKDITAESSASDGSQAQADTKLPASAWSGDPILAVLAFDNLSSDAEMQFFSDGVSEEIIQRLSRGAALKVIGRSSSFRFRGAEKSEAATQLNCSHVLDGSIRRAAGRIRVSTHLLEAASETVLWSDTYDRELQDIFAVQDEISEQIAIALNQAFARVHTGLIDPEVYDIYLRTSPKSFAPDELRQLIAMLEKVTRRVPEFAEAWGRLAYLRAFSRFYQPYSERQSIADRVNEEAARALELDAKCVDAMTGRLFVIPPFGAFGEADRILERIRGAPPSGDGRRYLGWYLRTMGRMAESLEESEREYRLNPLDNMTANTVALARMAAGRVAEAVPVYEDLVEREPGMSFPISSLLRALAFLGDWSGVDRILALAEKRQLREFQETIPFIRAKRDPTSANINAWWRSIESYVGESGGVDIARLVYSAHLGLVDEAYALAETARLGPGGSSVDIMGPDAYRPSLLFMASMPEMRNDPRFVGLCARLGLVEFWMASGKWPDCVGEVPYDFKAECEKAREIPKQAFGV